MDHSGKIRSSLSTASKENDASSVLNQYEDDSIVQKDNCSELDDIRAEIAMMKSALQASNEENTYLKNEIIRMHRESHPSASTEEPPLSSGPDQGVSETHRNERTRSWGKSTAELGDDVATRPARKPSPTRSRQFLGSSVIYLEDDEIEHAIGKNRRYAERPDARSSLSMVDLCGDDTNSHRLRKSPQRDQCSSSVRTLLENAERSQQLASMTQTAVRTKSLAELGGDSSYTFTRRPVGGAQNYRKGESLATLLHTQHDFVDQLNEQRHFQEEDHKLKQQQSRAIRNSPFANEVTSQQYSSIYEPLEHQLTLCIAEKTSLLEEIEKLQERGVKTLRDIARSQFIDKRIIELRADIVQLRNALSSKPE